MTALVVLPQPVRLSSGRRWRARVAVAAATVLLRLTRGRPSRLHAVLRLLGRGASPAPYLVAVAARLAVTTVSLRAASDHGCLLRSVAVACACRLEGHTVTWRIGVMSPPPACHAWVEAADTPVGELFDPRALYTTIITITPDPHNVDKGSSPR